MPKHRAQKWNFKWFRKLGIPFFGFLFKNIPLGLVVGGVCFIFLGVRQMLHADPYFQAERITVFPAGVLTDSEYRFLEAQTRGRSLVEVNLKEISQNLERNPKVKRAEVTRVLPRQLNVFITSRSPFIQVQLKPGGPYYSLARDQLVLLSHEAPESDLMILEDFSSEKKSYSVGALYQNEYVRALPGLFESIKQNPVLSRETISRLAMDQLGNVTLVLKDGIELRIGNELKLSDGAQMVLDSLLKSEGRNQILYVDLRYQDVIVKKKSSEA